MFGTTLDDEIAALSGPLGLDGDAVRQIVANGFRYGFEAPSPPAGEDRGGGDRP